MVTFKLEKQENSQVKYLYYPEAKESNPPGEIIVDLNTGEINITKVAPDDWEYDIPVEELNELAKSINDDRRERGCFDFVDLATEPEHSIYYGDHAAWGIRDEIKKGEIPERGMRAWY